MPKVLKIEERTLRFIDAVEKLKRDGKLPAYGELGVIMGIRSKSTISEILAKRQNVQPDSWEKFKSHFQLTEADLINTDLSEHQISMSKKEFLAYISSLDFESAGSAGKVEKREDAYKEKYILELQEKSQILKDQVQFLQRVVESSLIGISEGQKDLQAQVVASVRRSAERFVNDDPKKTKGELDKISKYAAQVRAPGPSKGIPAREGN